MGGSFPVSPAGSRRVPEGAARVLDLPLYVRLVGTRYKRVLAQIGIDAPEALGRAPIKNLDRTLTAIKANE